MPQYPAVIELSELDGENGFQINGEAAGDYSGFSVAGAGDVNGDGFDDLIVGAWAADPNGLSSGASYIVFGRVLGFSATLELLTLDGTSGFQINGEVAGDNSGFSVAGAGDVNGDGFADLLIGAPLAEPDGPESGATHVIFGRAASFSANLNLSTLGGTDGFQISGQSDGFDGYRSGWSVSGAGDVNGDGFVDVIVGAWTASPNQYESGASYVVFGGDSGFPANINLRTLNGIDGFKISGEASEDNSGFSVDGAGDVNGDGFADLLVGAPSKDLNGEIRTGASYVVFGRATAFSANLNLSTLDGGNGFQINGESAGVGCGRSVAGAGDVNGDGFADIIVGAPGADASGASYLVFGSASGFGATLNLSTLDGISGFKVGGEAADDLSGWSVAAAGDVNGDGFGDLVVGGFWADPNGLRSGSTHVVFGRVSGFAAELNLSTLDGTNGFQVNGEAAGDYSGRSVAGAGDVNGDGLADLIIGAPGADPNGASSGASYVVFGRKPDSAVDRTGTGASQSLVGSDFGDRLNGRGGDDRLFGHGGRDALDGGGGDDEGFGGEGRDRLAGRKGDDKLMGGGGADELTGGLGADTLDGGAGDGAVDVFRYGAVGASTAGAAGRDLIVGFEVGLDTVDLTRLGVVDFGAQAQVSVVGTGSVVLFDLDGDGAFDDFGLGFEGVVVGAGDFLT